MLRPARDTRVDEHLLEIVRLLFAAACAAFTFRRAAAV
jgi:hypothetical protein